MKIVLKNLNFMTNFQIITIIKNETLKAVKAICNADKIFTLILGDLWLRLTV